MRQWRCKAHWPAALVLSSALLLAGQNVQAEDAMQPFIGVSAGTSGFGLQAGLQLQRKLSIRLVSNSLSVSQDFELDGVDYDLDTDLDMPQLLVGYHPLDNGFYLSGGLTRNSSSLRGLATITGSTQIGSVTVTAADVGGLRARASYDELSPYAGFGWRSGMDSALAWSFEFGVTVLSEPLVVLEEEDTNFVSQQDLDAEAKLLQTDLEDELVAWPHLRIGVQYRF